MIFSLLIGRLVMNSARKGSTVGKVFGILGIIVGGLVFLLVVIAIGVGNNKHTASSPATETSRPSWDTFTAAPIVPAIPTQEPAAAPVQSGPARQFDDGQFTVGVDIEAGQYKTAGPREGSALAMCYTARLKNDSGEFSAIIANDIVRGPKTMTAKKGEIIENSGCATFVKIK